MSARSAQHLWDRHSVRPGSGLWRSGAVWLACLLLPGVALGATVRGQVKGHNQLINPVWEEAARSETHRYTWREPSATVRPEFRQLFGLAPKELCIAAISKQEVKPPAVPTLIFVGGGRTTPVTIVVAPGTRLQFKNNDPFKHRLYAVGQASFPAADMASLKTRDWTPPGPGTYELRDEASPSLRSWVIVKPNVAAWVYPDRGGLFGMNLEPGDYSIELFFAGKPIGTPRAVTVGSSDVDLTRQPIEVAPEKSSDASKGAEK